MSRDDLRLDIKFMMANNLIEIINKLVDNMKDT